MAAWSQPVDFVGPQPWPPLEQPTGHSSLIERPSEVPSVELGTHRAGEGQTLAIIDSGIAYDHEAFGGGFGPEHRVVGGWDFAEGDADPYDDGPAGFHGTHVAGIAAGDSSRLTGIAPGADLVALRIYTDWGETRVEWLEGALRWVIDRRVSYRHPITAVNLSIGAESSADGLSQIDDELRALRAAGVFVAVSAGNGFSPARASDELSYPAASESVIPVASVDSNGQLSSFSQRSPRVLAAPGRLIHSAVPDHVLGVDGRADDYSAATGTSMAAPYVAAASMVLREAWLAAGRSIPAVDDIERLLRDSADSVFDPATGRDYDRVNLSRALESFVPAPNNPVALDVPPLQAPSPNVVASPPTIPGKNDGDSQSELTDACVIPPTPSATTSTLTSTTYWVEEARASGASVSPPSTRSDLDSPVRAIDFLFRKMGRA